MLIIDSTAAMARALDQPLDPDLKRLLGLRRDQLAEARFIVVDASDTIASIERAIGFPLLLDDQPTWEWAERHGSVIEVAFIFGDAADVLLVPDRDGTDAALIALLHLHAAEDLERQQATAP